MGAGSCDRVVPQKCGNTVPFLVEIKNGARLYKSDKVHRPRGVQATNTPRKCTSNRKHAARPDYFARARH